MCCTHAVGTNYIVADDVMNDIPRHVTSHTSDHPSSYFRVSLQSEKSQLVNALVLRANAQREPLINAFRVELQLRAMGRKSNV